METESIGSSVGNFSSVATAPIISSGSSFGGETGSFSFVNTVPFNFSSEISDGGSFNPGFNFADTRPFMPSDIELVPLSMPSGIAESLSGINIDPDLPSYEISEAFKIGLAELNLDPDVEDDLLEPQTFLEAINHLDLKIQMPSYLCREKEKSSQIINILDLTETKPQTEIIEQINTSSEPQIESQAQVKIGSVTKTKNKVEREKVEEEEIEEDEEKKKKKKKRQLKFVVDLKALAKRRDAFQRAIGQAPTEIKDGMEVVDSNKVVPNMPTGAEKPTINSEIYNPKIGILNDLLDIGLDSDGSYLEAVEVIRGIGLRNRNDLYQEGSGIFRKLPPVTLAEDGEAVGEKDKDRVFTYKPDPIRQLRKTVMIKTSNN